MWLATQYGFYSIVQKPAGHFHVRTRCKMDLENIVVLADLETTIHHTITGDYAWRIVAGQTEVNAIMSVLAHSIDYSNFKDRIHDLPDQAGKLSAYSQLWSDACVSVSRAVQLNRIANRGFPMFKITNWNIERALPGSPNKCESDNVQTICHAISDFLLKGIREDFQRRLKIASVPNDG